MSAEVRYPVHLLTGDHVLGDNCYITVNKYARIRDKAEGEAWWEANKSRVIHGEPPEDPLLTWLRRLLAREKRI